MVIHIFIQKKEALNSASLFKGDTEKEMVIKFKETIEISEDEAGAISKVYCLMKKIVDESRDKDTQDTAQDIIDSLDEIIDKTVTSFLVMEDSYGR